MFTISNAISILLLTNSCHPQYFLSTAMEETTLKIWETKEDERRRIATRCICRGVMGGGKYVGWGGVAPGGYGELVLDSLFIVVGGGFGIDV
jgi:hypothetical protein